MQETLPKPCQYITNRRNKAKISKDIVVRTTQATYVTKCYLTQSSLLSGTFVSFLAWLPILPF